MATKKANSIVDALFDTLKVRFGAGGQNLAITKGADSSGNPTIAIGAGTAGGQNAFLRVIDQVSLGTNGFGSTQESYGPHIIQLALESQDTAATPAAPAGSVLLNAANLGSLLWDVMKVGAKVELYVEAYGTAPTVSSITSSKLSIALDDLYWPQLGSM